MCGRASLTRNEAELEQRFNARFYSEDIERYNPIPNYNIAPGHFHPVITNQDPGDFRFLKWGLVPFWAKDEKLGWQLINARSETLGEKTAFKGSFKNRRCLIPLDGFYEWKKQKSGLSLPYRFVLTYKEVFAAAGIWESWKRPDGTELHSFSIITVKANKTVGKLHNRMPAILFPSEEKTWLDNDIPLSNLEEMLKPFPDDLMFGYPVSPKVNSVKNNSADLVLESAHPTLQQGSLFED